MVLLIGDDLLARSPERQLALVVHLLLWSVRHTRWAHSFQAPDVSFQQTHRERRQAVVDQLGTYLCSYISMVPEVIQELAGCRTQSPVGFHAKGYKGSCRLGVCVCVFR